MTIRLRLALWYTGFLAVMFLLFAPAVYVTLERQLIQEEDRWLAPLGDRVARAVERQSPPAGLLTVRDVDLEPFAAPGVYVEVLDANTRPQALSPNLQGNPLAVPDGTFAPTWWTAPYSFTARTDSMRYRVLMVTVPGPSQPRGFVVVAGTMQQIDASLAGIRLFLIIGNVVGLALAVLVGWLIARSGLRPIEEITQTARAIALSKGFGQRLRVGKSRDEVGQLAVTFNEMLASLDEAYAAQRRFVADASHELRSPLTSIKSNIDILRRALDAPREDRAEALADVGSEVDRMSRLASDLLLLARADAGHKIERHRVEMDSLLKEIQRQMMPRADGIKLEMGGTQPCAVMGSPAWLKQLLLILLDNALKYTPRGGSVTLSLSKQVAQAVIQVRDTGIGITSEDLPHVFERFYRADKARVRDEGGAGLGLAIARWIAEEHGGDLSVQSEPGSGTTFTLRLPAA